MISNMHPIHAMDRIHHLRFMEIMTTLMLHISVARAEDIFYEWNISVSMNIRPLDSTQQVITINGMFPGPLINATTNDYVHINIFNNLDEPFLMTWNGIQQRRNSWQDGVSGTNCPIQPGRNWTYAFQMKDQIGSFFYFPSLNFQKAAGGYGPIRVNDRNITAAPFPKPEAEFDLLIGDWSNFNYTKLAGGEVNGQQDFARGRALNSLNLYATHDLHVASNICSINNSLLQDLRGYADIVHEDATYIAILMNGIDLYSSEGHNSTSFTVTKGKTYMFRISNVGTGLSFNFGIQNHTMVLVETEGSYTDQIILDTLDVHVGQSYSVLVTADQPDADYFIVAHPTQTDDVELLGEATLHYDNSTSAPHLIYPTGPDPMDRQFSMNQARSIRWNMTAGAAWPNPQGTFNVTKVTLAQTFVFHASQAPIDGLPRYNVNNVSYVIPDTPLKLADYFRNGSGVYELDTLPVNTVNRVSVNRTFVVTGIYKGWIEIVLQNDLDIMDSWHLDGFGVYLVGLGDGKWSPESRSAYNLYDPVVRSTVQVYPKGWSAIYICLDNPGMWNLRSQRLRNWYLGAELYIRVHDPDSNPAEECPPPLNILLCGILVSPPAPAPISSWSTTNTPNSYLFASFVVLIVSLFNL